FLPLEALALEPMVAATRPVRQVHPLGDDPFESESAGVLQHGWPVRIEMLAEAKGRAGRPTSKEPLQQSLTFSARRPRQIKPCAVKNIKGEVAKPLQPAGLEIGLQIIEARNAARILDDDFPVDQRRAELKRFCCARDARKAFGPVELFSR